MTSLHRSRRLLTYAVVVLTVVVVWTALSVPRLVPPLLLPTPSDVVRVLAQLAAHPAKLIGPVATTVAETAIAFAIALILAVPIGLAVGSSPLLHRAYEPLLTTSNALPLVVLYPVLAATLGVGSASKTTLGLLYAFFPMAIATARATASVDGNLVVAARTMGARRLQWLRSVTLPGIFAPVVASMRVSLGLALVTVIAAEFISGAAGVGYQLGATSQSLDTPGLFAWIVIACLLTIAVNVVFTLTTALLQKGVYR